VARSEVEALLLEGTTLGRTMRIVRLPSTASS